MADTGYLWMKDTAERKAALSGDGRSAVDSQGSLLHGHCLQVHCESAGDVVQTNTLITNKCIVGLF